LGVFCEKRRATLAIINYPVLHPAEPATTVTPQMLAIDPGNGIARIKVHAAIIFGDICYSRSTGIKKVAIIPSPNKPTTTFARAMDGSQGLHAASMSRG
jgi:hypothetical protein